MPLEGLPQYEEDDAAKPAPGDPADVAARRAGMRQNSVDGGGEGGGSQGGNLEPVPGGPSADAAAALRLLAQDGAKGGISVEDAAASFQAAVIESLIDRTRAGMPLFRRDFTNHGPRGDVLVVAGGVAANQAIGAALGKLAGEEGFVTRIPPPRLCTDNAAMIAWAGLERLTDNAAGDALSVSPRARWPLAAPA